MDPPATAWAARPLCIVIQDRRISATRSVREERVVYSDTTIIDRMHAVGQLSDRQRDAACRLYSLWICAGLAPRVTPRVDIVPEDVVEWVEIGDAPDPLDGETPADAARRVYRAILVGAGYVSGPILDALMHGQHPALRLPAAQSALDDLAQGWGLRE